MYKLIALDLDGTLLNSQRSISPENQQAIAAARAKGVKVVLVSGRPTEGMLEHAKTLNMLTDDDYILSYNASLIQNAKSKSIIHKQILTGKDAKYIASLAVEFGVNVHAFTPHKGLITPVHSKYTTRESEVNGMPITIFDFINLSDDEDILKTMVVGDSDKLTEFANQLPAELHDRYTIMRSTAFFLEFLSKKSNKGLGVEALANHLGINAEEVICMGDAGNDAHMIEYAGLGVAMGNATEEIKALAQHITATNNEHGVAKVINEFVLDFK